MKPVTACQTLLKNELPEDAAAACCSMGASGLAGGAVGERAEMGGLGDVEVFGTREAGLTDLLVLG